MITNARVMTLEEINELLSHMPDTTELKEIAGKMLKEYEEKRRTRCLNRKPDLP